MEKKKFCTSQKKFGIDKNGQKKSSFVVVQNIFDYQKKI